MSTGETLLKRAEAFRDKLIGAAAAKGDADAVLGLTIAQCVEKFLASKGKEVGETSLKESRYILTTMIAFLAKRGIIYASEMTADALEDFRVEGFPSIKDATLFTYMSKVHCFLRVAFRRSWIKEPLVDKLTTTEFEHETAKPYTRDEVNLFMNDTTMHPRFRLLMRLMLEDTGIRVGDAVRFDPAKLKRGKKLWVYTFAPRKQKKKKKQLKKGSIYLSDELKTEIDKCEWLSAKLPFFEEGMKNANYHSQVVGREMQRIGKRVGVEDCRPHRLRDTFAVRKLEAGVQIGDVSKLLLHSNVAIAEKYYADWTTEREDRLEGIVAESSANS